MWAPFVLLPQALKILGSGRALHRAKTVKQKAGEAGRDESKETMHPATHPGAFRFI